MRDIFEEIFAPEPRDPTEAARRAMRPQLRRRFYQTAMVERGKGGEAFRIVLDGKPVLTPGRNALAAPTQALAAALAAEWGTQSEVIDPARMPLTRLANSIIDGVVAAAAPVAAEIANYLASDLVLYRAAGPEGLVQRQARHWDPVVAWAREALAARFVLAEGLVYTPQPDHALAAARAVIPHDPWRLGAVHSVTTLTGSGLIALALAGGCLATEDAWAAAHVDEDWNMDQWGRDTLALERRAFGFAEMQAAARFLQLVP